MKNFKPHAEPFYAGHPAQQQRPRHVDTWRGFTVVTVSGKATKMVRLNSQDPSKGMIGIEVGAYVATGTLGDVTIESRPFADRQDALQDCYKRIDEHLGVGVRRKAIKDAHGHTVGHHQVVAHAQARVR